MTIEVSYLRHCGSDIDVVNAARVSFNKKSRYYYGDEPEIYGGGELHEFSEATHMLEKDEKLIAYLAKHKHLSPFGHCFASFYVRAPIFVARQLVKHKFLRWNEVSRRYVDTTPNWYRPDMNNINSAIWRSQTKDKKQGSGDVIQSEEVQSLATFHLNSVINEAMASYSKLLELGVCEEQARMVLPICHLTEWHWSGSLDAFADMCRLRCAKDAQVESKMVADQISDKMQYLFPVSWKQLMKEIK